MHDHDTPTAARFGDLGDRRAGAGLLALGVVLLLLLHTRAFFVEHREADEVVYLTLARDMGWNLSNYTTRDDPVVREFPFELYRLPLFLHPPLFPLVLKLGRTIARPVDVGLAFELVAMVLLLGRALGTARFLALSRETTVLFTLALATCPLLAFSTTRLHHDALLGIFLFCGLSLFVEALDDGAPRRAAGAGLLLAVAFNIRYSALVALPILGLLQAFALLRQARLRGLALRRVATEARSWRCLAIVLALVGTLGMQHYYRVLATYGTLRRAALYRLEPERASEFLLTVFARGRLAMAAALLLVFPLWLAWLAPRRLAALRQLWRERSWRFAYFAIALLLLAATLVFTPRQLRYYALAMPFAHLALTAGLVPDADWLGRAGVRALLVVSAFLSLATTVLAVLGNPFEVVPAALHFLPFLRPLLG